MPAHSPRETPCHKIGRRSGQRPPTSTTLTVRATHRVVVSVAPEAVGSAAAALLVTAALALPREITGTDVAAQAGWWVDYAEHATVFAMAGVLAASRGPGWRILPILCSAVWLYLDLVAALVLPYHTGSWGRARGAFAVLIGAGFAVTTWRRAEDPAATAELPAG
jgi:hypothetical protein